MTLSFVDTQHRICRRLLVILSMICYVVSMTTTNDGSSFSRHNNEGISSILHTNNNNLQRRQQRHESFFSNQTKIGNTNITMTYIDYDNNRDLQLVSGARPYESLRIVYDTRPIDSRRNESDVLNEKINKIVTDILPRAAALWAKHLYVRPVNTGIILETIDCGSIYSDYLTENVLYSNVDLLIVVGGDHQEICNVEGRSLTLAYANICKVEQTGRPVVGDINFCLNQPLYDGDYALLPTSTIAGIDINSAYSVYTGATFREEHIRTNFFDVTVHELAHVLGVSNTLMAFFRDEDGNFYTPVPGDGQQPTSTRTCVDGTIQTGTIPGENVVQIVEESDGTYKQYVITPRAQTIARNYFNCPTLLGIRMQNEASCTGDHWHERNHFADLLSPVVPQGGGTGGPSLFTMALFDDSNWYQVDYRDSTISGFGAGAGCGFVDEPCIQNDKVAEWNMNEFCDTPIIFDGVIPTTDALDHIYCNPTHEYWTLCDLINLRIVEANEVTYFTSDPNLAPFVQTSADGCPIPDYPLGLNCMIDDPYTAFYPGESVGIQSRCINAYHIRSYTGNKSYQPACMKVTCDVEAGVVILGQDDNIYTCERNGQEIPIPGVTNNSTFICPRLAVLCPEIFTCPNGCFGRGVCIYPDNNDDDSNNNLLRPYCQCFDTNNTHPSCAPEWITTLSTDDKVPTVSPVTNSPTESTESLTTVAPITESLTTNTPTTIIQTTVQPTIRMPSTQSPVTLSPIIATAPSITESPATITTTIDPTTSSPTNDETLIPSTQSPTISTPRLTTLAPTISAAASPGVNVILVFSILIIGLLLL